jgi:hypothetical protein
MNGPDPDRFTRQQGRANGRPPQPVGPMPAPVVRSYKFWRPGGFSGPTASVRLPYLGSSALASSGTPARVTALRSKVGPRAGPPPDSLPLGLQRRPVASPRGDEDRGGDDGVAGVRVTLDRDLQAAARLSLLTTPAPAPALRLFVFRLCTNSRWDEEADYYGEIASQAGVTP